LRSLSLFLFATNKFANAKRTDIIVLFVSVCLSQEGGRERRDGRIKLSLETEMESQEEREREREAGREASPGERERSVIDIA